MRPRDRNLGRLSLDKQFHGDLTAAAKGEMITAAGLAVKESPRRIVVGGETVVAPAPSMARRAASRSQHTGIMDRGKPSLTITVVPDSATGELAGLHREDGDHHRGHSSTRTCSSTSIGRRALTAVGVFRIR